MGEVLILRVRRAAAELPPWASGGKTLAWLGDWLTESLRDHPAGQRSPETLDILQEGNSKGLRADWPHVQKDETVGMTDLAEQRAGSRTQVKKESLSH